MNEFRKALIDVAGDLSESETAVKNALLLKKPRNKKVKIGYYLVPAVIVTLIIFSWQIFIPKMMDFSQAEQPTNEDLFEFITALEEMEYKGGIETSRANAYLQMVEIIGIPKYAKSIGITITDEDRQQAKNSLEQKWRESDLTGVLASASVSNHFPKEKFDENIVPLLIETVAYNKKLEEKMFQDYSKMLPGIANSYGNFMGFSYMETHYKTQLDQFKEQHDIIILSNKSSSNSGTVVAVEDNMFLFVKNMTTNEYNQISPRIFVDRFAAWFINDPKNPVQVGDYVNLKETVISEDRIGNEFAGVGLHYGLEILLPKERADEIKEIELTDQVLEEFNEIYGKAVLINEEAIEITEPPICVIHKKGESYTVWQNEKGLLYILPFGKRELASFTESTSKKMLSLFKQFINE
ncbi:hypothetical protein MKY51_10915 [Solibacillus sp. FSL R5-0691]|uniref:hypothetical protein n=1 Tax=Solibacillus sp. FSL R5-0691 TaxID=2921653 RepID=UPI0030D0602A